jgi:hypothetical protein
MEEENINLKQLTPFNGKEDILSAFLIKNTNNNINVNEKSFQEDFFFKPEQNYLDEYFGNENKSNNSFSLYKYNNSNDYMNYNTMKTSRKSSYENIQIKNEYKLNNPIKIQKINENNQLININFEKEREEKLLKNRLSARKCRQKKKKYITNLEEQVKIYKEEIEKYKKENDKKNYVENYFTLLEKNEKEIESCNIKKKINCMKNEYIENQKLLLKKLFFKQVKIMMPIECKIFQNKFIKVLLFEENDSPEIILNKIIDNLKKLNELYDFKNKNNINIKGKEEIAYKLYTFYELLQKYCELYITNLKSL